MPVSDEFAFPLLRAFGKLEYQLKMRPAFLLADRHGNALVNWRAVKEAVRALAEEQFVGCLSARTRGKVGYGGRDRPKVQIAVSVAGRRSAIFVARDLDPDEGLALVEAAKRVRNNLFHGGKEDPREQPFDGDDDQWAEAALEIATRLVELVDAGAFGPRAA